MTSYGIKVTGTQEECRIVEEVFEKLGFGGDLNENGEINVDEDYAFGIINEVEAAARALVSAVPNAIILFRGYIEDERSGELQDFEIEYDKEKITVKYSDWETPDYESEDWEEVDSGQTEISEKFSWFGKTYKSPESWDNEYSIVVAGQSEVQINAVAVNVSEKEDFGSLLLADLPLEIGMTDIDADFSGDGKVSIFVMRYVAEKSEIDNFAEALSVVLPNSKLTVIAEFKDADEYKYTYENGDLKCEIKVGDKYEKTDMTYMTEEQKAGIMME